MLGKLGVSTRDEAIALGRSAGPAGEWCVGVWARLFGVSATIPPVPGRGGVFSRFP